MTKKNKQEMKNARNNKNTEKKANVTPPQLTLYLDPVSGSVNFAPNTDLDLMTARGMVEEARDNLAGINRDNWRRGQVAQRRAMAKRQKQEANWNKKEKERLHQSRKNK